MLAIRRWAYSIRRCATLAKCMQDECVVPEVIDCPPQEAACILYAGGCQANMGNELTPTQVKNMPCVRWEACDEMFYALCLVDPDAPSREHPQYREWQHWLVGNIPGGDVFQGETLSEYIGAGPPQGTCLHRYIFLIFQQKGEVCYFKEPRLINSSAEGRGCFSVRKFASQYKLGHPIAGNFFVAQWDCYVPILYQQLGME